MTGFLLSLNLYKLVKDSLKLVLDAVFRAKFSYFYIKEC